MISMNNDLKLKIILQFIHDNFKSSRDISLKQPKENKYKHFVNIIIMTYYNILVYHYLTRVEYYKRI